jgi:hypothetical protein
VEKDEVAAAVYLDLAGDVAVSNYHASGMQPLNELQR